MGAGSVCLRVAAAGPGGWGGTVEAGAVRLARLQDRMDELFGGSSAKDSAALLIARIETLERREAQSAGAALALAERVETLERKNAELETTVRVRGRPLSRCACSCRDPAAAFAMAAGSSPGGHAEGRA